MDDQLDDDLRNRIREVFDNYEDTAADDGWLLLSEKYPETVKRRAVYWYRWMAAALLLLFLGAGILFNYRKTGKPQIAYHQKDQVKTQPVHQNNDSLNQLPQSGINITANNIAPLKNPIRQSDSTQTLQVVRKTNTNGSNRLLNDGNNELTIQTQKQKGIKAADSSVIHKLKPKSEALTTLNNVVMNGSTGTNAKQSLTDSADKVKNIAAVIPAPTRQAKKTIYDMFKNDNKEQVNKQLKRQDKKVTFSLYAATYFNYAKGSDNQFNGGAGLSSDISLSRNFKLSTGLSIGQNTLNYNSSLPGAAGKTFAAAAAVTYSVNAATFNVATPTFKNYSASLIALDVPVNLKFLVNPDRSDAFLSAGLSSGTFANETYVLRYNNPAFFNPALVQTQDETTHKSFSNFYFGNTLNLSFGIGYPVGKFNRLIIEPFLKYPLQGLGDQQIRFGSGGLNLKFNFQPQKK